MQLELTDDEVRALARLFEDSLEVDLGDLDEDVDALTFSIEDLADDFPGPLSRALDSLRAKVKALAPVTAAVADVGAE